jgi:enoyl-[acyl-carrier-protein] reductase (NADH)
MIHSIACLCLFELTAQLATAALMLMVLQELALTLQCLFALCNTQAVEAAKHGTRVNAVAPGELSTYCKRSVSTFCTAFCASTTVVWL